MRLIMSSPNLALRWVRKDAITLPFLRASTVTFHVPDIGAWPLPTYIRLPAFHASSQELFISGMFIEGIAGMISVTVTRASAIGLPAASVSVTRNWLSSPAFMGFGSEWKSIFTTLASAFLLVEEVAVLSVFCTAANSFEPP